MRRLALGVGLGPARLCSSVLPAERLAAAAFAASSSSSSFAFAAAFAVLVAAAARPPLSCPSRSSWQAGWPCCGLQQCAMATLADVCPHHETERGAAAKGAGSHRKGFVNRRGATSAPRVQQRARRCKPRRSARSASTRPPCVTRSAPSADFSKPQAPRHRARQGAQKYEKTAGLSVGSAWVKRCAR